MALRDISNVTQALINLLDRAFQVPANWTGTPPSVVAAPPIRTNTEGIGVYLYHVTENTHYKNLPSPGSDFPPIRYTSMGLNLYYQVSAHSTSADPEANNALLEQEMMAVALKTFHDYPSLNDTTTVDGSLNTSLVLPAELLGRNNRFKIVMQPIPPTEALSYWTPGESPLTLSAYYEVSVVLLEPETISTRTGRVTEYNIFSLVSGAPRILNSHNLISFISPLDNAVREIRLQPAQVPVSDTVHFEGVDLRGDTTRLRLFNDRFEEAVYASDPWDLTLDKASLGVVVQETAELADGTPVDVYPGIYGAAVEATRFHAASGQSLSQLSNQCPFTISPRIDGVVDPGVPNGAWVITGYLFEATDGGGNPLITVDIFVGSDRLVLNDGGPLLPGQYQIDTPQQLSFILPATVSTGEILPLRIFANGAESAPRWITAS